MSEKTPPISEQISALMKYLEGVRTDSADPKYKAVIEFALAIPLGARPPELVPVIAKAFRVTEVEVAQQLQMVQALPFDPLVEGTGWLEDYVRFTKNTEPPTVFHFFAGAVSIGAALGRNVYKGRGGAPKIFPNLCVLIIAPSGKCRKTSACNIAVGLLKRAGGNVLADKATPEAFVNAFKDKPSATGLIYAPEFSVFLGKQRYQEGMVPMLTALFDCPEEWRSETITRGEVVLQKVGLSALGCSTMDWIQTAIPKDAFGGGFMSRFLFVVQEDTPRCFPDPPPIDEDMRKRLVDRLIELTHIRGEVTYSPEAYEWFNDWYRARRDRTDDKLFAGYAERKPDHLVRLAIVLEMSRTGKTVLSKWTMERALAILNWLEEFLPNAFGSMQQTAVGEDQMRLLKQLKSRNGEIKHSDWLRLNSNKMRQREFRELVDTLKAAGLIVYDSNKHSYYLTPEGWKY
jgi:hypothetical protein